MTDAVPIVVVPSKNVTVPVAGPPLAACTVATKGTTWPNVAGFKLETSVVVVLDGFTVSVRAEDVLPAKFVLPPYTAVIEWEPAARVVAANCAELLLSGAVPSDVEPSKKVTVPVAELPAPA